MALAGGSSWTLSYVVALLVGSAQHVPAFPLVATLLNVSWELAFGLLWPPENRASRVMYRVWLALDLGLLWQAFAWGAHDVSQPWLVEHFSLALTLGLGLAVAGQALAYRRFEQPRIQAYVVNLVMSIAFVQLFFTRPEHAGLSLGVAALKLVGTSCISAANVASFRPRWTARPVMLTLFATIFALDVTYLSLLGLAPRP